MKFRIRTRNVGDPGNGWWEDYDKATDDAEAWARKTINEFNGSLHHGEKARELLEVVVVDSSVGSKTHQWAKTNAFTVRSRTGGTSYDTFQCTACGITGRRYGLGNAPLRDRKYRAKVYENCQKAKEHLAKIGKTPVISMATA